MPRSKSPRFVRSPAQTVRSYQARAENLRRIAALSHDPQVKEILLRRAGEWDLRAAEIRNTADGPILES
jgi:hypothetical protein